VHQQLIKQKTPKVTYIIVHIELRTRRNLAVGCS